MSQRSFSVSEEGKYSAKKSRGILMFGAENLAIAENVGNLSSVINLISSLPPKVIFRLQVSGVQREVNAE